jgi:hypothetical protein
MNLASVVVAGGILFAPIDADANLITSISGGTVLPFPAVNLFTAGPETVAPGVTWSSTTSGSVYGFTDIYGFGDNGNYSGSPAIVGLNAGSGSMTFNFATPLSAVGGTLNWVCCLSLGAASANISVFDATHTLIETFTLSNSSLSNIGTPNSFYGFSEGAADISYFT